MPPQTPPIIPKDALGTRLSQLAVSKMPRLATSQNVKQMAQILVPMTSPPAITFPASQQQSGAAYTITNPTAVNNYGVTPADTTANGNIDLGGAIVVNSANGAAYVAPRRPVALNGVYSLAPRLTDSYRTETDRFELQVGSPVGGIFLCVRIYINHQPVTVPRRLAGAAFVSGSPVIAIPAGTAGILPNELLSHPYLNSTGVYVSAVGGALASLSGAWSSGTSAPVNALTNAIPQGATFTASGQTFTVAAAAAAGATSITTTAAPTSAIASGATLTGTNTLTLAGAGNGASSQTTTGSGTAVRTYGLLYASTKWLNINFGTRAEREIYVEIVNPQSSSYTGQFYLSTIGRPSTASLTKSAVRTARAVTVHDSYGEGVDGQDFGYGSTGVQWSVIALRSLGIRDVITSTSIASTGIVHPSSAYGPYNARLADVYELAPDLVLYCGSLNDPGNGVTGPQITAQAQSDLQAILTNLPAAVVVVTGILFPGTPPASYLTAETALGAAVTAIASPRCVFVPVLTAAVPPFFGTGHVGSLTSDGPADFLLGADGTHPSPSPSPSDTTGFVAPGGHYAVGRVMGRLIGEQLNLSN